MSNINAFVPFDPTIPLLFLLQKRVPISHMSIRARDEDSRSDNARNQKSLCPSQERANLCGVFTTRTTTLPSKRTQKTREQWGGKMSKDS